MTVITEQIVRDLESLPLNLQEETLDFVRFLKTKLESSQVKPQETEPNGKKIANLMAKIAQRGTAFRDIKDPVAWQREIRK